MQKTIRGLLKVLAGALLFVLAAAVTISLVQSQKLTTLPEPITATTPDEAARIERVLQTFYVGTIDQQHCPKFQPGHQVFCYEGSFYAEHLRRLATTDSKAEFVLEEYAPKLGDINPQLSRAVWLTALGLALAQANVDPRVVQTRFRDANLFAHVVDGWAFQSFVERGFTHTHLTCLNMFKAGEFAACQFGMGRAAFFFRRGILGVQQPDPALIIGYNFARSFTRVELIPENGKLTPESLAATALKRAWVGELPANASVVEKNDDCFETQNFVSCLARAVQN